MTVGATHPSIGRKPYDYNAQSQHRRCDIP